MYKYDVAIMGTVTHSMPREAIPRKAAYRDEGPQIWVEVPLDGVLTQRSFAVIGTGTAVEPSYEYIDSFFDGEYVWHVFEVK